MADLATTPYPIVLTASRPPSSSRFWAIPIIGAFVKGIILIPHLIILYVLGIVLGISHLVIWIPVLFTGHYPEWAYGLNAGYLRWVTRLAQYFYGLTDFYPAFSMDAPDDVHIDRPTSSSRFFAIPAPLSSTRRAQRDGGGLRTVCPPPPPVPLYHVPPRTVR